MALLCLVRPESHCYRAHSLCSSPASRSRLEDVYAVHASVLRGAGICGGSLNIPAATSVGDGSGHAVAFLRIAVRVAGRRPGRAPIFFTPHSAPKGLIPTFAARPSVLLIIITTICIGLRTR